MSITTVAPARTRGADAAPSTLAEFASWRSERIAADGGPGSSALLREAADPAVVAWLNLEAPGLLRPGARVLVAGCGLGFDVVELLERGYDATGIDACSDAIDTARRRFPAESERFVEADCFDLPSRLRRRFDLTIDSSMIALSPPDARAEAASAIAESLCPHGALLVVCEGADPAVNPDGLTAESLVELLAGCGMAPTREADDFMDDSGDGTPVRRLRAAFRHV